MRPEGIRQGDIPGVQVRLRGKLPLGVGEAWAWLTDPPKMERWLGAIEERSADSLTLSSLAAEAPRRERLETRERHAPRLWSAALRRLDSGWQAATLVTFELAPDPAGGCELSILQQGFQQLTLSTCLTEWESYRRRWRRALARLEAAVADSPPGST